jgi:hypothetical protein
MLKKHKILKDKRAAKKLDAFDFFDSFLYYLVTL